jgi:hypothetical protein
MQWQEMPRKGDSMGKVKAKLIEEMENTEWQEDVGGPDEYQVHLPKGVKEKDFFSKIEQMESLNEDGEPEELDFDF